MLKGVDVSKYQDTIDWPRMKNEVDFAIIRAGYGCPDPGQSLARYIDSKFYTNRDGARSAGILRGYYWYSYSKINSPEAEGNAFADAVLPLADGEILALDLEGDLADNPVDWSLRFLNTVFERTGVRPIIYINQSINNSYDWQPVVDANYGVWLAGWDYVADPQNEVSDWPFVAFEQYSNQGNVGGEAPVDLDSFNGTAEQFLKYGYHAPVIETPPPPADPHEAQIAGLNETIAGLNSQINGLNDTIRKYLDQITELNRVIDEMKKAAADAEANKPEPVDYTEAIKEYEKIIADNNAQIARLQKQSIFYLIRSAAAFIASRFKKRV